MTKEGKEIGIDIHAEYKKVLRATEDCKPFIFLGKKYSHLCYDLRDCTLLVRG
jgi:hypothetical protein